jgi:hypothetical protein
MSATARPAPVRGSVGRTARAVVLAAFLAYALSGGGRIVGSDEVAMFQLSRALLHGRIEVPPGATLRGPDGRHYTKNAAGQAVAALPLAALAEGVAAPFGPVRGEPIARALVSLFNAIVTAVLLGAFYATARELGAAPRAAMAGTLLLGFATPVWVYAKSFMAEPLQALGLLLALGGAVAASRGEPRGGVRAGLGVLLAVSAKLSMLPLALVLLLPLRGVRGWRWAAGGVVLALAGHALYNAARFGTPFETGYGAQATPSAYTTPLLVGLYGLLFSSGKGLLWFAPPAWLAPGGLRALAARSRPAAWAVGVAVAGGLVLYAKFEHWAGDGSFGPRYLLPVLPLLLLGVAVKLSEPAARAARLLAWGLGLAGLLVQLGGVAIYYGAQMRERGDYPYTLPLSDPRFMGESHWNPYFSPIADHWRMAGRNLREHLEGRAPSLRLGEVGAGVSARTGLTPDQERSLLHALDFWWCYAAYAGVPVPALAALVAAGLLLLLWAGRRAAAALRAEVGT